jgi:type IV pilus assembly protein PilY1
MTIDQTTGFLYVGGSNGFKTINLSNHSISNCSLNNNFKFNFGSTVSGGYLYFYRSPRIYRSMLNTSGSRCPQNSTSKFNYNVGNYVGLEANPNNPGELYALSWIMSNVRRLNVNSSGTGYTTNWNAGSRSMTNTSASAGTYFYYPWGLGWDATNNRLIAADLNKGAVQIFDTSGTDPTWIKNFGGAPTTRMQAAHAAIKSLVTDASLTSGVDYGFAYWAHGSAGFTKWNGNHKTGTGKATPCNKYNCLKVPIFKGGAAKIAGMIHTVNPGGGTDANLFMKIAQQYYSNTTYSPRDASSPCQKSYVIVIGDGDWGNHSSAVKKAKSLLANQKVKPFAVAFGTGISANGLKNFNEIAAAGGTSKAIVATTAEALKSQLKAAISQIIASKLSFTAPAITATIATGGSLYQAQFDYLQNKEWAGTITRTKINPDASLDTKDSGNWSAADVMPKPASRKLWSVIPGTDYKTDYNNFKDTNATEIGNVLNLYGNDILDYHRDSDNDDGSIHNKRCATSAGVIDGVTDDLKGLINFVRGTDYFDYAGGCKLTAQRVNTFQVIDSNGDTKEITKPNTLGDIYHSQLVVVGAPSADTAFVGANQEAYWRSINGYALWAESKANRKEIVYAGSNSGILHAFNAKTGVEEWGFIPPLIAPNLPLVMNTNLNQAVTDSNNKIISGGGSNAIFGVDGSLVVHDMYFKTPGTTSKAWHTIMFVPYGRGGAGFSVIEITDPDKPLHLYSIYNDVINHRVYRVDHEQNISAYDYIAGSYSLAALNESIEVTDNYNDNSSVSDTCQSTRDGSDKLTTSCYRGKVWTLPVQGLSKSDLKVIYNDAVYNNFSVTTSGSGDTVLTFSHEMTYAAAPTDANTSSALGISIKPGTKATGVLTNPEYDYSKLGETWSDPRIFRIPNNGTGDTDIADDIYVAAMGGGYGTQFEGVGSNLTIVDLEDLTNPGRLYGEVYSYNQSKKTPTSSRVLDIEDIVTGEIVNSTPGSAVLVTPDTARGITFSGGLLYLSDLEGKITKFNLTNMTHTNEDGTDIKMFDSTSLFTMGSTKSNGRYMFHSMDATIGQTTNSLWLFAGTGNYERINDTTSGVSNLLVGIKDRDYPLYKKISTTSNADDITKCKNTSSDTTGASCPEQADKGWYIVLDNFAKVTAEPTAYRGLAYFPIYEPTTSVNKCTLGNAFICAVDDECGTNVSSQLGTNSSTHKSKKCFYVGQGVLSKIVVFADKLFANIAGQSSGGKKDLVTTSAGHGEVSTYRSSWRGSY